jgi:hypothetical protein
MPISEVVNTLIGIVSYNHRRFLAQCLDSVTASAMHNSLRVVLAGCGKSRAKV